LFSTVLTSSNIDESPKALSIRISKGAALPYSQYDYFLYTQEYTQIQHFYRMQGSPANILASLASDFVAIYFISDEPSRSISKLVHFAFGNSAIPLIVMPLHPSLL
jgi:hypothetical protein